MRKYIIGFLLIPFLTGCGLLSSGTPIFNNPVCEPPCWHNVTPGATTEQDALVIFNKLAADGKGVLDREDPNQDGYDKDIRFSPSTSGNSTVFVNTFNNRVSVMKFEGDFALKIRRTIELFGEPESVLVVEHDVWDQVIFLNRNKGIAFERDIGGVTPSMASGQVEITPNDPIASVVFFDPNQYDRFVNAGFLGSSADIIKNNLHPWNGYGKIIDKYWPPITPLP